MHQKILDNLRAQNILINDAVLQFINPYLPFGGVGTSGIGANHGKATFDEFSLYKSVMIQNMPMSLHVTRWVRKPPYTRLKVLFTNFFLK